MDTPDGHKVTMEHRKINATKDYSIFNRGPENRPTDVKKRRRLIESMKEYGFLPCFPVVCYRDSKKHLIVKDGQHRLAIAEMLGLTVYWVEESYDFDPAKVAGGVTKWSLPDYAGRWAANGRQDYQDLLDFSANYNLPIGTSAALLGGSMAFRGVSDDFYNGDFVTKDKAWAERVGTVYSAIKVLARNIVNSRLGLAIMSVCRVKGFDPHRLIKNAERVREKLVSYSTKEAYLDMLEEIYNYSAKNLVPLKIEVMKREREEEAKEAKAQAKG